MAGTNYKHRSKNSAWESVLEVCGKCLESGRRGGVLSGEVAKPLVGNGAGVVKWLVVVDDGGGAEVLCTV